MEQYNLTNTGLKEEELSEQELNEQDLAEISGGSFLGKVGGFVKGTGRFVRDGAAGYGALTIINGFIPQKH